MDAAKSPARNLSHPPPATSGIDPAAAGESPPSPAGGPAASSGGAGRIRRHGRFLRRLGPAGPMAVASLLLPPLGAVLLLGSLERLRAVVHAWPAAGPVACVALFCLLAGLALLPTAALAIFAGWAFGFAAGYPVAVAGFTGAGVLGYAVARAASGRRVVELVDESPRWRAVHRALLGSGWWRTFVIVALLRLPAAPPFAATTVALASLRCRWSPYALGTLVGIAPRTAAYVHFAAEARDLALKDFSTDAWFTIASLAVTLAVLIGLAIVARRALARLTQPEAS